ncbi:hypothetical protein DFAR_3400002 [Desulfarculales bacterium]
MFSSQRNSVVLPKANNTTTKRGQGHGTNTSLFSQLLHHFPRTEFAVLVKEHGAAVRTKGLPCQTQFVAMLFCHLARADSLRESCHGPFLFPGQAVPP